MTGAQADGEAEAGGGKLKVLSFGGNGNIGSAVLAAMIQAGRFDIVMTTRGGWHWDSDTRIGANIFTACLENIFTVATDPGPHVRTVKCNRDYQPPCAADSNATDCDINAVRQCKELMEVITETERSGLAWCSDVPSPR